MTSYHYIVVGGGSAGCVMASRLSADPTKQVLLIEAGHADGPAAMASLAAWPTLLGTEVDWADMTVPQAGLGGARLLLSHGRVLGGSSGINAGVFLRGHRANFDKWAADGATGWDYDSLLPFFRRSETAPGRDSAVRGTDGPMVVAPMARTGEILDDVIAAALEAGYPASADLNGTEQEGVSRPDMNFIDGVRQSVADAYLRPVLGRKNLTVATDALARRLIFADGRCTAVEYVTRSRTVRVEATSEVVLTAGAIGSAHLLMVSGIGPAQQLREHGIDVVLDRPGVGANLQDQPLSTVVFEGSDAARPEVTSGKPEVLSVRLRMDPSAPEPDLLLTAVTVAHHSPAVEGPAEGFSIAFGVLTPVSRGSVRLAGADITTAPLVDPNYLGEQHDLDRMLAGLRIVQALGNRNVLGRWRRREALPGPHAQDDASLVEYLRRSTMPWFHPVGTCRMGGDQDSVVDPQLRVRGVKGLRIADASVMPTIVSATTHATVLAIAERAASFITLSD
jgi:choline dehydrogenase